MEPALGLLEAVWESLGAIGDDLSPDQWRRPTDCPGWTVHDQYAHMIGTESILLGRPTPDVTVDEAPHVRNDIGRANERWVASFRTCSGREVLDAFRAVTKERLAALSALTPEEWEAEGFTPEGPGPYRQFMEIRVFDCWFHEQDVREAIGSPGGIEGPVADAAIGRIAKGMPYVVGKKAAAPNGAVVVFHVEGSTPFDVAVGVSGRAALLDEIPDAPTCRLTMDRRTFARLAGGRRTGEWARAEGLLSIEGDEELGRAVVANMGYTI